MTFTEAYAALLTGKPIRRRNWVIGGMLIREGHDIFAVVGNDYVRVHDVTRYGIHHTDWEVIE